MSALIALVVALIPQVTFVFSYLNSDAYGLASIALLISTLVSFLNSPTRKRALYLGMALGLMFMAKLYFIPALVFAFTLLAANRAFKNTQLFKHAPTAIVVSLVVSLPMLLLVYTKYGEISGVSGQIDFVNMHKLNPAAGYGTCYLLCGDHFLNTETVFPWLNLTLKSYFSVTGWMNIFIPNSYYLASAFILISIALIALYQMKPIDRSERKLDIALQYGLPLVMIIALYPSITLMSLIASQNSLPQPQGRYLFVTIPFLGLLLSLTAKRFIQRSVR